MTLLRGRRRCRCSSCDDEGLWRFLSALARWLPCSTARRVGLAAAARATYGSRPPHARTRLRTVRVRDRVRPPHAHPRRPAGPPSRAWGVWAPLWQPEASPRREPSTPASLLILLGPCAGPARARREREPARVSTREHRFAAAAARAARRLERAATARCAPPPATLRSHALPPATLCSPSDLRPATCNPTRPTPFRVSTVAVQARDPIAGCRLG